MHKNFLAFQEKFQTKEQLILKTDFWTWSLRPIQCTLGAGVISLNTYTEKLSDIDEKGGKDLVKLIQVIEPTLKRAFDYSKINYLMLMMIDPHLHYHVIPRYSKEIMFEKIKCQDIGWPRLPVLEHYCVEEKYLPKILKHIRNSLP